MLKYIKRKNGIKFECETLLRGFNVKLSGTKLSRTFLTVEEVERFTEATSKEIITNQKILSKNGWVV